MHLHNHLFFFELAFIITKHIIINNDTKASPANGLSYNFDVIAFSFSSKEASSDLRLNKYIIFSSLFPFLLFLQFLRQQLHLLLFLLFLQ